MAGTITKDTLDEATKVGAFLRAAGFIIFILAIVGGFILVANSHPLAGIETLLLGAVSGASTYGIGLLLRINVERG